jgi:hypothetical protein
VSRLGWLTRRAPPPASAFDHDAPELEATLPATVAGRPLVRWSVAGDNFWKAAGGKRVRSALTPELAALGVAPTDMEMAVAGREDTRHDPPFIIWVLRFGDLKGVPLTGPLPLALAMGAMRGNVNRGENWRDARFAGRQVLIGNRDMISQNRYHVGLPYVWLTNDAIYALVADDEAWAEEVIRDHEGRAQSTPAAVSAQGT